MVNNEMGDQAMSQPETAMDAARQPKTALDAARIGAASFGNAEATSPSDEVALIQTGLLLPDNTMLAVTVQAREDGLFEIADDCQGYNVLSDNGMDSSNNRETHYVSYAARDAIYGLMDAVIKHGCGLMRDETMLYCRVEADRLGFGAALVAGATLEVSALIYPWRAGLLRGGGLPEIAGMAGEIRRFKAALTGEDVVGRMNEMGVKLSRGHDLTEVLDAVQRAMDYGQAADGAVIDRDKALAELLEKGVLRNA